MKNDGIDYNIASTYQRLAMRTANQEARNYSNLGLGITGEAGEVADIIKKHLHQNHPLDREALIEELGDVAWYIALGCELLGCSLAEVFAANIIKLADRYPTGFDPERSINRD